MVLAACGSPSAQSGGGPGYVTGEGVVEQTAVSDREPLPRLRGGTLDGSQFDTAEHDGSVLVVNVWGSWCPPCRAEAPGLRRVWDESRADGVQFVGLNVRDTDAAAIAFERRYRITYPSITTEESGEALLALRTMLPPNAIPSTLVVDRDGNVAARVIGRTTYRTLRALVDDVLESANGAAKSKEAVDVRSDAG
nr:TlpA disulfide reductase family protein [Nocardioides perillae]